jgi:hypothetical protein
MSAYLMPMKLYEIPIETGRNEWPHRFPILNSPRGFDGSERIASTEAAAAAAAVHP